MTLLLWLLWLAPVQGPQSEDMAPLPWTPVAVVDGDPVVRGLPRDGIPALDHPAVVTAAEAAGTMRDDEYVIGVVVGGESRAYAVWQLNGHEVVNDTVADHAIVVTWCPLCYTAMVYDRQIDGRTLTFGIEGVLWRENMVLYDRDTGSWWSQAAGKAIRGDFVGRALTALPSSMTTWAEWRAQHPETRVMSKQVGNRPEGGYDMYAAYHASGDLGVTGLRRASGSRDPKSRLFGFRLDGRAWAIDAATLDAATPFVSDQTGRRVVVGGSPTSGVHVFLADGRPLTVDEHGGVRRIVDGGTGSIWDPRTGISTDGPLTGTALTEVPVTPAYWFAWQAFFPDTTWLTPPPRP